MSKTAERVPYKISAFVRENFCEDFLFTCRKMITNDKRTFYKVEVSKDNITHQFIFTERGVLMDRKFDADFPADSHEESFLEENPE
jgi:hypothetical protein